MTFDIIYVDKNSAVVGFHWLEMIFLFCLVLFSSISILFYTILLYSFTEF